MIRLWIHSDREALIQNMKCNVPEYFAESEIVEFMDYLNQNAEHYYVYEDQGKIIGSGGINYFLDEGVARISWDIIHPSHQNRGIGKQLVLYRINEIKKIPKIKFIIVRTSQMVYPFYQQLGFELDFITKDYWVKGFDLYQMQMNIQF
ncbi:MAG TPA: GNAT family N-acetyltransferase [Saprospiraceae bacterium]|nr:GNAT family N-acetyltransferase [Saprospiraceae bacterium]